MKGRKRRKKEEMLKKNYTEWKERSIKKEKKEGDHCIPSASYFSCKANANANVPLYTYLYKAKTDTYTCIYKQTHGHRNKAIH